MLVGSLLRHEATRARRSCGFTVPRLALRIGTAALLVPLVSLAFALGLVWVQATAGLGLDGIAMLSEYALPFVFLFATVRVAFDSGYPLNPLPYVGLSHSRRTLVGLVIVRSLCSKYTLMGCLFASGLLLAPVVLDEGHRRVPMSWLVTMATIWLAGNLVVHPLRHWLIRRPASYVSLTALVFASTSLGWLSDLSIAGFGWLQASPNVAAPVGLAVLSAVGGAAYLSLVESTYLDGAIVARRRRLSTLACPWLGSPNPATRYAALMLCLIVRVPKARAALLGGAVMVAAAAFIYWLNPGYEGNKLVGMGVLAGFYSSGSLAFFVGQLLLSWHGSFYDLLAYAERDAPSVVRGRVLGLRWLVLMQYALAAPLFAATLERGLFVATSFAIFNLGCVPPVAVWISLSNSRRIDLYEPGFFAQESGSGALESSLGTAVLVAIPLAASLAAVASEPTGLAAVATVGAVGIALGPAIERRLAALHCSRRYTLGHRLRQRC